MKIGILGTGQVAQGIAAKLSERGHQIKVGSRTGEHTKGKEWVENLENASLASYEKATRFGEMIFNCVAGVGVLDALKLAGKDNFENKILVDVSNPLDFSKGMPPSLFVGSDDSLAEQIQRALPSAKVVKVLNTLNVELMVNPSSLPGEHNLFMAGDNEDAKKEVCRLLTKDFGWPDKAILDLGDISAARGTEAAVLLWVRLWTKFQNHKFNFHIVVDPKTKR
ncbi:MAG: NAD(P)-binding domain-containing protein [Deltaproteobacteria bacterium]|nr:NAD(P)-binding domain-containing protein [Deltaproteobacteria bacterium]